MLIQLFPNVGHHQDHHSELNCHANTPSTARREAACASPGLIYDSHRPTPEKFLFPTDFTQPFPLYMATRQKILLLLTTRQNCCCCCCHCLSTTRPRPCPHINSTYSSVRGQGQGWGAGFYFTTSASRFCLPGLPFASFQVIFTVSTFEGRFGGRINSFAAARGPIQYY